ncbi:MAG: hypothetical protein ACTH1Z_03195 [Ancrocorticia sp.]|uniref:hypothetical protein n=2 Tax=Ancrocorticia sp. TaxID=2593684 RepID=UPI003F9055AC
MDQAMHHHWLVAERRIDVALGGLAACGLWMTLLPVLVFLRHGDWSALHSMAVVAAIPVAVICAGLLAASLRVARAIEERDQDELARWRTTLVAPVEPDLLQARLRRVHYLMLAVIVVAMGVLAIVAGMRLGALGDAAEIGFVRGIVLIAMGIGLAVATLMLPVSPRAQLRFLVIVSWPVPVGAVLCALALMFNSDAISAAVSLTAMASFVFVIAGIIVMLIAITAIGFWVAWVGRVFTGRSLLINDAAREVPEISSQHGVAEPEFDEVDVEIVADALLIDRQQVWLAGTVLLFTVGIVALAAFGFAGTPFHGVVAGVMAIATIAYVYRVRSEIAGGAAGE